MDLCLETILFLELDTDIAAESIEEDFSFLDFWIDNDN